MMITSHGAAAVLATTFYAKLRKEDEPPSIRCRARAFLFGILPDLPLTALVLIGKFDPTVHYHHRWITHTPVFWLVISALTIAFYRSNVGLQMLVSTWLHLGMDWYGGADGIPFLYPLTTHQYGLDLSGVNGPEGIRLYLSHPLYLLLEILLNGSLLVIVLTQIVKAMRSRQERAA
jgi:hypothetical protein